MRNLRLHIAYDGTDFYGWQRQPQRPTVQGGIEAALVKILGARVNLIGAGRTDTGVHAANQVANLQTASPIPCANLQKALNGALPSTVRILQVGEAPADFHARFKARAKVYRYRILQAPVCPPFIARFVHHVPYPLDRQRMTSAARRVQGEFDFTSFAAAPSRSTYPAEAPVPDRTRGRSAVRRVSYSRILWRPRASMLVYEIRGDGFLHHMVRNLAGTLIEVGRGKLAPADISHILEARDRTLAGPTAPPRGLCLMKVEY